MWIVTPCSLVDRYKRDVEVQATTCVFTTALKIVAAVFAPSSCGRYSWLVAVVVWRCEYVFYMQLDTKQDAEVYKMVAVGASDMSVPTYQAAGCFSPKERSTNK